MIAVGLAFALYEYPPPSLGLVMAGGIAATSVLALAVARLDAAVALGILLLAVVNVEPAPPDLVFMAVIAVAAVTGRFDIGRVPKIAAGTVAVFLGLNVLSLVQAIDPYRASFFVAVTMYLAVFSLWFASYLDSERKARIVVLAYLTAAVLSALLGVLALYVSFPGSPALLYDPSRVEGLFKDPNVFGPFLIPIALILLEEMLQPRLLRVRGIFKAVMLLILVIGIVFSFSRAAWLNLAVGISVVTVITVLRSGLAAAPWRLVTVLAAGGLVAAAVVGAAGADDFIKERASIQRYDAERFGAQEQGLELAAERPARHRARRSRRRVPDRRAQHLCASADRRGVPRLARLPLARGGHVDPRREQRIPWDGTRTGSVQPPCWAPGWGSLRTAPSRTRCTGVTCGSWPP